MANKCSQCGFEAKDQNELREHMKTHSGGQTQERERDTEDM